MCGSIVMSMSVCVSVCRKDIPGTTRAIFTNFCACCLWLWLGPSPASLRYVMYFRFCEWHHVFSIMGRIAVWNALRKTDFALMYLFTINSDRTKCPIIKGRNFDSLFPNYLQTKIKEKRRNLTINGKNYRNACIRSYCYFSGSGERWRRNKYTSDFDAWT